ncbi:MAG: STAS domain-containing protein [Gammaproteobacteria bacterium]|nr:STAS domain-containing protein [Gammaproteobacteria bacterium]
MASDAANQARLSDDGDGRVRLSGRLDFGSVPEVWPLLERRLDGGAALTVSLDGVGHANSAGLVLLVEALHVARRNGVSLSLVDVPAELLDLAHMSGCAALIAADD